MLVFSWRSMRSVTGCWFASNPPQNYNNLFPASTSLAKGWMAAMQLDFFCRLFFILHLTPILNSHSASLQPSHPSPSTPTISVSNPDPHLYPTLTKPTSLTPTVAQTPTPHPTPAGDCIASVSATACTKTELSAGGRLPSCFIDTQRLSQGREHPHGPGEIQGSG